MDCQAFPTQAPEIEIAPQPESALQEVTRVDVEPYLGLVLCPGAEGYHVSYSHPERELYAVEFAWVSGIREHTKTASASRSSPGT